MYKVLLVDDEALAVEGLKLLIKWETLGYEVCGECANGQEALDKIKTLEPDLVVTDIRMPVMDGLDLIASVVNDMKKNIRFIVTSGYSDFGYARRALHYGVNYYVLKPVLVDEMSAILLELRQQLDQQRETEKHESQFKSSFAAAAILKAINSSYDKLELYNPGIFPELGSVGGQWYYMMIEVQHIDNGCKKVIKDIMDEAVMNREFACVIDHGPSLYGLVMNANEFREDIRVLTAGLFNSIQKVYRRKFCIAVGESFSQLTDFKNGYDTALKALNLSFYEDVCRIIYYEDMMNQSLSYVLKDMRYVDAVQKAMEELDSEKIEEAVKSAFSYFKHLLLAPDTVKIFVLNIVHHGITAMNKMGGDADVLMKQYDIEELDTNKMTALEMMDWSVSFCRECIDYQKSVWQKNSNESIKKIEEYIKNSYKGNITIKEMSKSLYMHPAYLGKFISDKFGVSFNEYIHKLRIEEAKSLIANTAMKTSEIAYEVGYTNYNRFLRYFEKHAGMKAVDYKTQFGRSGE